MIDKTTLPYRPCAGIMMLSHAGQVFVAQRLPTKHQAIRNSPDYKESYEQAWQMPQGGIDEGEEPLQAALREAQEETSVKPEYLELIRASRQIYYYDLPDAWLGKLWAGRYRGQAQHWFLFRFHGSDDMIDIEHVAHQEFLTWRWADISEILDLIVPFKQDVYRQVIAEFKDAVKPL